MAKKRMFSNEVVTRDSFLHLPLSSQALYFHFGVQADDDGFVSNPEGIMRMVGANKRDGMELIEAGYIKAVENGVVLITNWLQNNYLRKDRYTPSKCLSRNAVVVLPNDEYSFEGKGVSIEDYYQSRNKKSCKNNQEKSGIPMVDQCDTQIREDKISKEKISKDKIKEEESSVEKARMMESEREFDSLYELYPHQTFRDKALEVWFSMGGVSFNEYDSIQEDIMEKKLTGEYLPCSFYYYLKDKPWLPRLRKMNMGPSIFDYVE